MDAQWSAIGRPVKNMSVIYALLGVKSLKQTMKLSDQNIWDNADAELVLLNGW